MIECHYPYCPLHGPVEEGPFCNQVSCSVMQEAHDRWDAYRSHRFTHTEVLLDGELYLVYWTNRGTPIAIDHFHATDFERYTTKDVPLESALAATILKQPARIKEPQR